MYASFYPPYKIASNWYNKGVKFLAQKQAISRRRKTLISLYTCPHG